MEISYLPRGVPQPIELQGQEQPLGLILRKVEHGRKKIFGETAAIIMLAQNLSSSLIDLHNDDRNLMSLKVMIFCQISLKLANHFKTYGAGVGERLTNTEIILFRGGKKKKKRSLDLLGYVIYGDNQL